MANEVDMLRHDPPLDAAGLVEGSVVALCRSVRTREHDSLILGGSPFTMLHVNAAVKQRIATWRSPTRLLANAAEAKLARRLEQSGFLQVLEVEGDPAALPTMTVVIPTHGRVDEVAALLERLEGEAVIVVDDGTEATLALELEASCHLHGARYVRHESARGPGAARNSGAALATTDVVCFVDSDVTLTTRWKQTLLSHFFDPQVGAVAPRIGVSNEDRLLSRYEQFSSPLDLGDEGGRVKPLTRLSYVPSALLLVRQPLAARFDEGLRVGEDVDFIWSLVDAGWTVRYVADVVVFHPTRKTVGAWIHQRLTYGRSAGALALRHGEAVTPVATSGWTATFWLGVITGAPALAASALAVATGLLTRRIGAKSDQPLRLATATVVNGSVLAGPPLLRQVFRTYGVPLVGLALFVRPLRRPLGLLIAICALPRWWKHRGEIDPFSSTGLQVAEDLAYGTGVILGSVDARTRGALRPSFTWFRSSMSNEG